MENSRNTLELHPQFLDVLFAFKSKAFKTFREVLGIHELHHISVTRVDENNQMLSLSSTPALEFNLFSSPLWIYDNTYSPSWFHLKTQEFWQALYHPTRYDELYYLKQIKHTYPVGLSMASKVDNDYIIYSLASNKSCNYTKELFTTHHEDFYKIGQYCYNMLYSLFNDSELFAFKNEFTADLL